MARHCTYAYVIQRQMEFFLQCAHKPSEALKGSTSRIATESRDNVKSHQRSELTWQTHSYIMAIKYLQWRIQACKVTWAPSGPNDSRHF